MNIRNLITQKTLLTNQLKEMKELNMPIEKTEQKLFKLEMKLINYFIETTETLNNTLKKQFSILKGGKKDELCND